MTETPVRQQGARGLWAPASTPVGADGAVDHRRLIDHVRWLLGNGCHGVVLWGTTSEGPSFSLAERRAAVDAVLESGAVAPASLLVGTGVCALPDSVELTRHALASGCLGVLVMPPFFYRTIELAGLADYYRRLIDDAAIGAGRLYYYHFPRMSGVPVTIELIRAVESTHPGVAGGLKDSSGNWDHLHGMVESFPELAIFPGSETLMLAALEIGGRGCISAIANCNPHGIRAVYDAVTGGARGVRALNDTMCAIRAALDRPTGVRACKAVLAHYRGDPGWNRFRPPLAPLDETSTAELIDAIGSAGFDPAPLRNP